MYYIFCTEKQLLPEELQKGVVTILQDKHTLQNLYERFKLPLEKLDFPSFFAIWKRKFLFSQDTPLHFLFEQRKMYSSTKVLCKAAKYRRFDFVDEFLTRKRLWCSAPHIEAICKGIYSSPLEGYDGLWHEEKVKFYRERIFARLEGADVNKLDDKLLGVCADAALKYCFDDDVCDEEFHIEDYIAAQRWDKVRELAPEMEEPLALSSMAFHKPKIYFHPELIPEDLREYFLFDKLEDVDNDGHEKIMRVGAKLFLKLIKNVDQSKCKLELEHDTFCYDLDNLEQIGELLNYDPKLPEPNCVRYALGLELELPFFSKKQYSIYGNFVYQKDALAAHLTWACKKGLFQEENVASDSLEFAINYALEGYIHEGGAQNTLQFGTIYERKGYYPELLRCLCKHHLEKVKEITNQEKLLLLVKGDKLMEEYVQFLKF